MTDTNPAKFTKLVTLLKELFQLDQPDLDFGIYRIMHAKAGEVTQFLERDLLPQVKDAFAQYQSADSAELKRKLEQMIAQLTEAGVDPDAAPKVKELRELLKGAIDLGALENETSGCSACSVWTAPTATTRWKAVAGCRCWKHSSNASSSTRTARKAWTRTTSTASTMH